jgi:DNA-binding transcriptional ArsR family regulator
MEESSQYHTLLKDPNRRKIVEILSMQEKIGFKELRQTLGLGVGTVYYHLDMLSGFVVQDKQRKYYLSDRGRLLYRVLKEGNVPATLAISETISHRAAKWLFLSPLFAKTIRPLRFLPISFAILALGAIGSAYAQLDPALFFYLQYPTYGFASIVILYFLNWLSLFMFAELFIYALYRRRGNDLQLLVCIALASFPIAILPCFDILLACLALPATVFPYLSTTMQIWSLLLVSAAFCFGKGIRLDKGILVGLAAMYINMAILFLQGRFT